MRKALIFIGLCFLSLAGFSQSIESTCVMDDIVKTHDEVSSKAVSCTRSSNYWWNNSLYVPDQDQDAIYLKANFIFLTKPDGTGNFEENNAEHQEFIDEIISGMNHRMSNIINPSDASCNTESTFLSNTKIQIVVNKIWEIDPAWDFLVSGFTVGGSISVLYPPSSSYYYSYLDDDPTIPEGINIVFANNGDIYEELYVNQNYTVEYPLQQWAASQFPTTYDLSRSSRQFFPDVFNKYTWMKEVVTVETGEPWSTVRGWHVNGLGLQTMPHEFGHSLGLYHDQSCDKNIMYQGWPASNYYFKPEGEIGKMHRLASTSNIRDFFTDDSYTSSNLTVDSDESWDLDFRLYSDILVDNSSELSLTCNLILPPQSRIKVKDNSTLKIDGGTLSSANNATWNGIKVQDNSSLEILPGAEISDGYFYAYTDNSSDELDKSKNARVASSTTTTAYQDDTSSSFTVYPNPTSDFLTISLERYDVFLDSKIRIIDVTGNLLKSHKISNHTEKIDIQNLKAGIYYVLIGNGSKAIIKQ